MDFDFEKAVKEICKKKQIKENQFKDYLSAFGTHMIEREVDRFVGYCEADGWHDYVERKFR